jgi:hypothetical protein
MVGRSFLGTMNRKHGSAPCWLARFASRTARRSAIGRRKLPGAASRPFGERT